MRSKTVIPYAILYLFCFMMSCQQPEPKADLITPEMPAIPVTATKVHLQNITNYIESIGHLFPLTSLDIHSQALGPIQKIYIQEGQLVSIGDPLFEIDPNPYQIKVNEAKAKLAIDKAQAEALQMKLKRFESLSRKDLVPQTELDDLKAQVNMALATLDLDEAQLHACIGNLNHCYIHSPISGRVGKLSISIGQLVSAGNLPLAHIVQLNPLIGELRINEQDYLLLLNRQKKENSQNLPIEISMLCDKKECTTGTMTFLDNHFDPKTGLILIRAYIANPDLKLRPGQTFNARIPIDTIENAKLIPQKAIRYNPQGPYVYIIQEDMTVALKQVVLGKEVGLNQIILEGIEPNDQIILEGHLRLAPGSKVEIKS